MKNTTLIIGALAILAVGIFTYTQISSNKEKAMMVKEAADKAMMEQKDNEKMMEAEAMKKEEAMKMMEAESAMKKEDSMMKDDKTMMKEESMESDSMMKKEEVSMTDEAEVMMKTGSYAPYSADKIAMAATGDVVLFFKASWCPSCKAIDADIKANLKNIPADLTILEVDYDNSSDLKKKYGVTYQHTFVQVDKDGKQIKKWSGSPTLVALVSEVQ